MSIVCKIQFILWVLCLSVWLTLVYYGWTPEGIEPFFGFTITTEDNYFVLNVGPDPPMTKGVFSSLEDRVLDLKFSDLAAIYECPVQKWLYIVWNRDSYRPKKHCVNCGGESSRIEWPVMVL